MNSMDINSPAHYRNCNLCEAICGIEITVGNASVQDGAESANNSPLEIRGDKADPFSQGFICPKAVALQDLHYDKDRLKQPIRRSANGWQTIGWDEAFDEVAGNLTRVQRAYGRHAVATYLGNPTVHSYGALLFAPNFIRSLHTRNRFSATSVDQLAHHFAGYFMFGHQLLLPVPDLDRTNFFMMIGANPAASNGSLMTAPGMPRRLQDIRARGGKVVLVDPRRNETAAFADQHLFIRPGTDAFLLLALLNVIFERGLTRLGALAEFTDGIDTIGEVVASFSPEKVAPITGIESAAIRALAHEFAAAESAVCHGRIGVSTQEFGGLCQWLINVLNTVTGNLDRAGGAMFALPAFDPVNAPESLAPRGSYGRWRSRARNLPEFGGELPVAALAEEILTEGDGQIKALVTHAGNPVLSTPNGRELDRALASLEFMASIDFYLNETTRHANIIVPPTGPLERGHYDLAFHLFGVRNIAKFSPPLFETNGDTRHEWQIFLELQTRLEGNGLIARAKRAAGKRFLGPERLLDLGLRLGPYGDKLNPLSKGLNLRKLKRAVHGIDLGPLKPCLPKRLRTADKRIKLAPEVLVKDIERLRAWERGHAARNGNLLLIGRRHLRSNNSWLHNSERLVKGKPRCTMLIHPEDAAQRAVEQGQRVIVQSRAGSIEIPIEISDEMMLGVVCIPHGWGHDRPGVQLEVAGKYAGTSINDLTDNLAIDELCGTAAFNGTPVTVKAAD